MPLTEGPRESGHISEVVTLTSFFGYENGGDFNGWSERVMVEWTECK